MRFQRAVLICNPKARKVATSSNPEEIGDILRQSARDVEIVQTAAPKHAAELARNAQNEGCDLLAVYGGDGTVNEVIQGVVPDCSMELLVLPGGTANVFVREVGLSQDPYKVASQLPTLTAQQVPLGHVEFLNDDSRYFLLMCGAGLDARIAERTNLKLKHHIGETAYWLSGLHQAFRRFPRLYSTQQGKEQTTSLILVSKSRRYGGGFVVTPGANLLKDQFEVAYFKGTNKFRYFSYLLSIIFGTTGNWPGIRHIDANQIDLVTDDPSSVPVQVDGEVAGILPARITLSSIKLPLLLPNSYWNGHVQS